MTRMHGSMLGVFALAAGTLLAFPADAEKPSPASSKLPDPVAVTFAKHFPKSEIVQVEVTEKDAVTIYEIEFREEKPGERAAIAEDGAMLEFRVATVADSVPQPAMKAIRKAAKKATIDRIDRIEILREAKDGSVDDLSPPLIRFAAEMTKKDRKGTIVVADDGKTVERASWVRVEKTKKE